MAECHASAPTRTQLQRQAQVKKATEFYNIADPPILPQALLASLVSLLIGCLYLAGTLTAWRDLRPESPAR